MIRIIIPFIIFHALCFSQEMFDGGRSNGSFGISFGRTSPTQFLEHSGTYESRWSVFTASVPVYRSMEAINDEWRFHSFALNGSIRSNRTDISLLSEPRQLTTGWGGGTYTYGMNRNNVFLISVSAGMAEDKKLSGSTALRFRLTGLGMYRMTDPLQLLYGINYSALLGRDLLLPVIGVRWRIAEEWSASVLLPLSFSLRYRAARAVTLQLAVHAAGEYFMLANRNEFTSPSVSDELRLRMTGVLVSLRASIPLWENVGLTVDAGSIANRTLTVLSENTALAKERLEPARQLSVGLRYTFLRGDDEDE